MRSLICGVWKVVCHSHSCSNLNFFTPKLFPSPTHFTLPPFFFPLLSACKLQEWRQGGPLSTPHLWCEGICSHLHITHRGSPSHHTPYSVPKVRTTFSPLPSLANPLEFFTLTGVASHASIASCTGNTNWWGFFFFFNSRWLKVIIDHNHYWTAWPTTTRCQLQLIGWRCQPLCATDRAGGWTGGPASHIGDKNGTTSLRWCDKGDRTDMTSMMTIRRPWPPTPRPTRPPTPRLTRPPTPQPQPTSLQPLTPPRPPWHDHNHNHDHDVIQTGRPVGSGQQRVVI